MHGPDAPEQRSSTLAHYARALRQPLVAWFSRRVREPSDAEDLVQEVMLRVTQRGHLDDICHIDRYLFQTAASVLADRQRRRAARSHDAHVPLDPEHHGDVTPDAHRAAECRETLRHATRALQDLPERTRAIFLLRRIDGLKYQEIASRFGLSVSTVEKDMQRAVEHLNTLVAGGRL